MQFQLSGYARALTGNSKVRVEIASGAPRTDGNVIYYQPPIALGDLTPHDRFMCGKRDKQTGLQSCPACKAREEILVNIYHEISHIAEDTFAPTTEHDKQEALKQAIEEWGGEFAERIKARFRDKRLTSSYLGLANIISPYLPSLVNSLEDARVDLNMFRKRKGTRKMMVADTYNLLANGIPDQNFQLQKWDEAPLNSQASLALYMEAADYPGWQQYFHPAIGELLTDKKLQQIITDVRAASTAADTYNLAFPALARLRELGYFKTEEEREEEKSNDPGTSESPSKDDREESGDPSEGTDKGGVDPDEVSGDGTSEGSDDGGLSDQAPSGEDGSSSQSPGVDSSETPPQGSGEGEPGTSGDEESAASDEGRGGPSAESDRDDGSDEQGDRSGGGSQGLASPDAGKSEMVEGMQQSPEESVDADSDGVPEESGEGASNAGGPEESEGEGGSEDRPASDDAEKSDGASDTDDTDTDAGSSEDEGRSSVGEADGNDSGEHDDPEDGQVSDQPDDSLGDDQRGGTSEDSVQDSSSSSEPDIVPQPDHGNEADSDRRPDSEGGESRGPDLIESGADKGLGGIDLTDMPWGSPEDVETATNHLHEKIEEKTADLRGDMSEKQALTTAILQGMYFETPSVGVDQIVEHTYAPSEFGWAPDLSNITKDEREDLMAYGVICDMDIPEQALGPVLLKTRRIFTDNKIAELERNRRSGRVNTKVLGRRAWSGDDRLFAKKRLPGKKDYAVKIMIDISSSNLGNNLALVKRAAFAQAELLSRVGIPFSITAHSAHGSKNPDGSRTRKFALHLHHIKTWDEPWNETAKDAVRNLIGLGGNLDGHAMEFGRKELEKVEATDKILLYYTDGKFPAANKEEELEVLLRQLQLCKRDQITLLGVGIRTDSPVRHGLDTVQVDGDEDLGRVVEHLGKRLQRSAR